MPGAGVVESMACEAARRRIRLVVRGVVQGVGFRPFVFRLATDLGLTGFVFNDAGGVVIEIEGTPTQLDSFRLRLADETPQRARIDRCDVSELPAHRDARFIIAESNRQAPAATLISPDLAVCDDCLAELADPTNRRFRYPFINCTNCGPRYTIVERTPYDRPYTSMRAFAMCPACEREYHDPFDRRFHAQPVACPACGPRLFVHDGQTELAVTDPVVCAQDALRAGRIVGLRDLGGFHLAVDAHNDDAVRRLRKRKLRAEKPFALLAPDVATVRRYAVVSAVEEELLLAVARPIVLVTRRSDGARVAEAVAAGQPALGFMLPSTPLHHLLLAGECRVLVLTSGNLSEEPIAIGNDEALARLAGIADLFLLHDRDILERCDDSVLRVAAGAPRLIRRARGFVPEPIYLAGPTAHHILAAGAELKNTVAVSRGDQVFFSQHIGDLDNPAAFGFYTECVEHLCRLFEVEPDVIACDLHPEYLSTKWAHDQDRLPVVEVQHHHAHLASVQAEHGRSDPAIGIILDGTGMGTDGTIWGGEVLVGDPAGFERFAWLEPVPLPGGAQAIREPWRMALSYLHYAFGDDGPSLLGPFAAEVTPGEQEVLIHMIKRRLNSPPTSSCGRLFDGVSALLGICGRSTYEAQAAIALEATAAHGEAQGRARAAARRVPSCGRGALPFAWLIRDLVERRDRDVAREELAADFHFQLAELFVGAALAARAQTGLGVAALSGGVFQNVLFFEYLHRRLAEEGFEVLAHNRVPTNDGGIPLGQVVIADTLLRAGGKSKER
jgi:hydrogenase maturation protein HypF